MSECDCKFNVMKDKVPFVVSTDYLLDITVISVKSYEYEYTNV